MKKIFLRKIWPLQFKLKNNSGIMEFLVWAYGEKFFI